MRYLLTFLIAAGTYAQSAAAPRLGFTTEGNQLIPVWGVPGAARLGDAVDPGGATQLLAANPAHEVALAVRQGETGVLNLPDGTFVTLSNAAATQAAWSPSGRALVMLAGGQVEVFVRQSGEWTRQMQAPGQPEALAVSDDGHYLLTRTGGELVLWHDGSSQMVAANVAAFAFVGAGSTFAYQSGEEIVFADAQLQRNRVASNGDNLLFAVGDGLISVRRGESGSTIARWSASGELLHSSQCPCEATRLSASGNGWVRIHAGDGGPLWMTDGTQIFFIPVASAAAAREEGN